MVKILQAGFEEKKKKFVVLRKTASLCTFVLYSTII